MIRAFARVARTTILRYFGRRSCIASSRITIECLKIFGVESYPVPVRFILRAPDLRMAFVAGITPEEQAKGKVNYNYELTEFPSEEGPGLSVFCKDADGRIFHTYSSYARGLDIFVGAYNFLDHAPKGRDEDGLAHTMAWVRHHDRYDPGYFVDSTAPYVEPAKIGS